MIKQLKKTGLRARLLFLVFCSAVFSIALFYLLATNIGRVWELFRTLPPFSYDEEALVEALRENAINYELPPYDDGKNQINDIPGFFEPVDDIYTGVYVYGLKDSLYRASIYPTALNNILYGTTLQWGLTQIEILSPSDDHSYLIEFKNETAEVLVRSYRSLMFVYPYFILTALLCITVFLLPVLLFINRRIRDILQLKEEILLMSAGDLTHPIPSCGSDEIGVLGKELDALRKTLCANITKEQESRRANQDLIMAVSHDLRTPLTILKGYLEVLNLKRDEPDRYVEYLGRCLKKTADIQELTDRMFEYALVYEVDEYPEFTELSVHFLGQCLSENIEFIRLAGFTVETSAFPEDGTLLGDKTMLKRIFNNLFSNILKYGDKKTAVSLTVSATENVFALKLSNTIKTDLSDVAGNQIGLKSTNKMIELHHGTFSSGKKGQRFLVELTLPLA